MADITKSIGTSSRDYSTITSWEADLDNGAVYASGDGAIGVCYNDSAFDESVTFNGGGTVGLSYVWLTVAAGHEHDGAAGAGARIVMSAARTYSLIPFGNETLFISWLEINCNNITNTNFIITVSAATVGRVPILRQLLIHDFRTTTAGRKAIEASGRDTHVVNCVIYDCGASGSNRAFTAIDVDGDQASGGCRNNTVYNCFGNGTGQGIGIRLATDSANAKIQNNISMGTGGASPLDFSFAGSTNLTSQNNLSSDATADDGGGSGHLTSKTAGNQFVSTTGGSEDLHLKAGADAINAGVDLGTTHLVNIDIDGRDRDAEGDTWDIGADEYVSLGGAYPFARNPMAHMLVR